MTRAARVVVRGRVQGVGFRAWTAGEARRLGLSGWVRNRPDGSVEAVVAGEPEAVATMLARFRDGPALAGVETCEESAAEAAGLPARFEQRPTG